MVLAPISMAEAEGARLNFVLLIVRAGPPGERVWPPMRNSDWAFAVRVEEPRVIEGGWDRVVLRGMVLLPMTMAVAEGARLSWVPPIARAEPPGERV